MLFLKPKPAKSEAPNLIVRNRPNVMLDADIVLLEERTSTLLAEYAAVTKAIGFQHPHIDADLRIEAFKAFLRAKDWGIFSLKAVIEYMDKKAAEESEAKAGWHWHPLREVDHLPKVLFGRAGRAQQDQMGHVRTVTASDHYHGEHMGRDQWSGGGDHLIKASGGAYDKLVPLHALRKVKEIEGEFKGNGHVAFFVSDYAPAPHIEYPDPFLMAVVNNARLNQGVGRFVIDFWDEPGFGLDKQLA